MKTLFKPTINNEYKRETSNGSIMRSNLNNAKRLSLEHKIEIF